VCNSWSTCHCYLLGWLADSHVRIQVSDDRLYDSDAKLVDDFPLSVFCSQVRPGREGSKTTLWPPDTLAELIIHAEACSAAALPCCLLARKHLHTTDGLCSFLLEKKEIIPASIYTTVSVAVHGNEQYSTHARQVDSTQRCELMQLK
jgi:hypothetical protein